MGVGDELPAAIAAARRLGDAARSRRAGDGRPVAIRRRSSPARARTPCATICARTTGGCSTGCAAAGRWSSSTTRRSSCPDRVRAVRRDASGQRRRSVRADRAVEILAPAARLLHAPNRITGGRLRWLDRTARLEVLRDVGCAIHAARFEPRQGQPPQRGGWLTAHVGKGRWTYMAYALHRQVPYGVPGAYRILANLISN